jgi:hypothetical protein
MKKLIVPKFSTEAEEAVWWDSHMDVVEENLVEAIQGGTASAERLSARKGLSSPAYSLNSRTISTQAFTFSTGVSGRIP